MNTTTFIDEDNEPVSLDFRQLLERVVSKGMTAGETRALIEEFEQKHAPEVHARKKRFRELEPKVHDLFVQAISPTKNLKKMKELLSLLKEARELATSLWGPRTPTSEHYEFLCEFVEKELLS